MADVVERQHADDRHGKILDAVGELVVERGVHGVTTALVARRARVAPGKFYELFSDKYAVIQAAADRNLSRFFDALVEDLDGARDLDVAKLGRTTLEVWIELCRRDPAFRVLRFRHAAAVQSATGTDADARLVSTWMQFVEQQFGLADTPEIRRAMTLAVKFALDPIEYAFELDPQGDPEVLDQVRRVLDFHLAG
ncbi:MAG TPA: TetR/AcrR family transcriptional regulator [Nocardioidaceae bacterium]|nr:TetR/AcrR family transcriptional regulator [Nocardioidaceae bacterium]